MAKQASVAEQEFRDALHAAGSVDHEFRETPRVHEHAAALIIRRKRGDV